MIKNLINEDNDIQIVIRSSQLEELADMLWKRMQEKNREREETERNRTISKAKACEMLEKDPTTLWRWEKEGYLTPVKVGGRTNYRLGDIQDIIDGKR